MGSEEKKDPRKRKGLIVTIFGVALLIGGISLAIYGINLRIIADGMFGDFNAPWFETSSRGTAFLTGGIFMIILSILILISVTRMTKYKPRETENVYSSVFNRARDGSDGAIRRSSEAPTKVIDRAGELRNTLEDRSVQLVKVRCALCGALNDEDAAFCDQCAEPI